MKEKSIISRISTHLRRSDERIIKKSVNITEFYNFVQYLKEIIPVMYFHADKFDYETYDTKVKELESS